ncbi:unnamed protein product [Prunus armeniaca]
MSFKEGGATKGGIGKPKASKRSDKMCHIPGSASLKHDIVRFGELMSNFPVGQGHPSWDCSSPNSLNFGVPITPKSVSSQKASC